MYLELFGYLWHVHALSHFFQSSPIFLAAGYLQIHLHGGNDGKQLAAWGSKMFEDHPLKENAGWA